MLTTRKGASASSVLPFRHDDTNTHDDDNSNDHGGTTATNTNHYRYQRKATSRHSASKWTSITSVVVSLVVVTLVFFILWDASKPKNAFDTARDSVNPPQLALQQPPSDPLAIPSSPLIDAAAAVSSSLSNSPGLSADPYLTDPRGCYHTVPPKDPSPHIVVPPVGPVTLVCCQTTLGVLNIAVHPTWAPLGAQRVLQMVENGFFSSEVAFFRALAGFLVQFGIAGDPKVQAKFDESHGGRGGLPDDPQWLPPGPPGREINGVARFQKGYLSYAGAGKNSRGTQLIMALIPNKYLGGGSPWEVPWGQLVGESSLSAIDKMYTKYGEKVSQGKIFNRGNEYTKTEFPLLDYITHCEITAKDLPWESTFVNPPPAPSLPPS